MTVAVNKARVSLADLRFSGRLSDDQKDDAYIQVLAQLDRLAQLEADLRQHQIHVLNSGQILSHVHLPDTCAGEHCVMHNPSNHHMIGWPAVMRTDDFANKLVERICPHGIGHPDPDSAAWLNEHGPEGSRGTWGTHGCDGCCHPE